jgi:tripartite-type tricarboxylate transporter receptor subunit TctC
MICAGLAAVNAVAQSYPAKPIHIIVGLAAGGSADTAARILGQKISETMGQIVIVENRLGAGSAISIERVASSPADGYTLLMMTASGAVQSALQSKLPYDLERDLAPIAKTTTGTFVLAVHPTVPVRNVKELIAMAHSWSGKLSYGSSGIGGSGHLAGALFNLMAKTDIVHVPYKGSSEAAIAIASGQIDIGFPDVTSALPLMDSNRLKAIAITSDKRSTLLPKLPTISESGLLGYDRSPWNGILAPAHTPRDIITRLNVIIVKALSLPEMKAPLNKQGLEPQSSTPEQFSALIHREIELNAKLIKLTGIKAE